jgi:hypothetical protein
MSMQPTDVPSADADVRLSDTDMRQQHVNVAGEDVTVSESLTDA